MRQAHIWRDKVAYEIESARSEKNRPPHAGALRSACRRVLERHAALRGEGLIAAGPRSPTLGAPYAYVTTPAFLSHFGFESLRDLPDIERLEDAGLLRRTSEAVPDGDALASELRGVLGLSRDEDEPKEDAA